MPGFDQLAQQPGVVEHIGVHHQHRSARGKDHAGAQQGDQAATLEVGIMQRLDKILRVDGFHLGENLVGAVADHQHQRLDAERAQNFDMAREQRPAAEAEQYLGRIAVAVTRQPGAAPGGQHDRLHVLFSLSKSAPARSPTRPPRG